MKPPEDLIEKLLPLLRAFCPGLYGIAMGGSYAKGSGIVQQTLQALVQVLFALNRKYFPGEKKLA